MFHGADFDGSQRTRRVLRPFRSVWIFDFSFGQRTTDPVSLRRRFSSKLFCRGKNPCFVALWPGSDGNHRSRSGDLYNYTTETRLHFVKEQLPRATRNEI